MGERGREREGERKRERERDGRERERENCHRVGGHSKGVVGMLQIN